MEREIVVVGAGPAGATAAMALAQKGRDVLLLDRQQFPRDKTCGDGIPAGAIDILYDLGMHDTLTQANFHPVDSFRLVSPNGYTFKGNLHQGAKGGRTYVVPRYDFDVALQQHAIRSGAEFCQAQVKEPILENGQVKGVQARINGTLKEIRAKIVIAADGVTSVIGRALQAGKLPENHRAVALRAYIENMELWPNEIEFYLYKSILPGYAWIFPTANNKANIGLGMRLDKFNRQKASLEEMLQIFLNMPEIKKRLKADWKISGAKTWQLNFGSKKVQLSFDGAILVGDAGNFINPLTGGGIHNALISAHLASEIVEKAFAQNEFTRQTLKIYDQQCYEAMWESMRSSYLMQRYLLAFPWLVDWLIKRAGVDSHLAKIFMTKL